MNFTNQQKDMLEALAEATIEYVHDKYDDFYEWDSLNGRTQFTELVNAIHNAYGSNFIEPFKTAGLDYRGYHENFFIYTILGREAQFKSWKKMLDLTHGDKKIKV